MRAEPIRASRDEPGRADRAFTLFQPGAAPVPPSPRRAAAWRTRPKSVPASGLYVIEPLGNSRTAPVRDNRAPELDYIPDLGSGRAEAAGLRTSPPSAVKAGLYFVHGAISALFVCLFIRSFGYLIIYLLVHLAI